MDETPFSGASIFAESLTSRRAVKKQEQVSEKKSDFSQRRHTSKALICIKRDFKTIPAYTSVIGVLSTELVKKRIKVI